MPGKSQFSLRVLFVVIAAVAVIAAEAAGFPVRVAGIVGPALTSLLPVGLIAGIVYARDYCRAFCIGALSWLLAARWIANISVVGMANAGDIKFYWNSATFVGEQFRVDYSGLWSMAIAGGLLAVFVRRLTLSKSSGELD